MAIEVRQIRDDELVGYIETVSTAFLERPDVPKVAEEVRSIWDLERCWAAFDGDRICATFRSWPTELTVPGNACLPASAISAVTVLPTHRRRGILRKMIAAEHAAIRERGEAFGLLYASEYPIYGRFGYGPACRDAIWTIDAIGTALPGDADGGVEIVRPSEESRDALRLVFDAWRSQQPGEIKRRDYRWEYDLGLRETNWGTNWKGFLALRRDGSGAVDGYARYRAEEKWERSQPRAILNLDELHALNGEAYAALWRFLLEIDWVGTVKAERRSLAERLPWLLTNARAATVSDVTEGMWVRLFDVPRALTTRSYEREASLVLDLVDDEAPGGRIRVELEAGPAGSTCRATDRTPDLTVHIGALGAAYLGGAPLRQAVLARGADEHRAGALVEADALFRTLDPPWNSTFF